MRRVQKPDTFKNIFTFKERERKRTWKRNRQRNSCIYLKKKKVDDKRKDNRKDNNS